MKTVDCDGEALYGLTVEYKYVCSYIGELGTMPGSMLLPSLFRSFNAYYYLPASFEKLR